MASTQKDEYYITAAKKKYQREGEIEIDDDAKISRIDDEEGGKGAYVQAWVWVDDPDEDL